MSPLALGLPLSLPALPLAARGVSAGLGFLQSLLPGSQSPAAPQSKGSADLTGLQQTLSNLVNRAGLGRSLPIEIANDSVGRLNVVSGNADQASLERVINSNPTVALQFRALAERAGGTMRLIVPATNGFDASV
jgi:hypothetical protein